MAEQKIFLTELRLLFIVFIAFFLMVGASIIFVSRIMEKQIKIAAVENIRNAELVINNQFHLVDTALLGMSYSLLETAGGEYHKDQFNASLKNQLQYFRNNFFNIPGFISIYGNLEGEYFTSEASGFRGAADPAQEPWYRGAAESRNRRALMSRGWTADTGKAVVSKSLALFDEQGRIHGVIAMDFDLAALCDQFKQVNTDEGGCGLLIDRELKYIIHPDPALIGTAITSEDKRFALLKRCLEEKKAGDIFSIRQNDQKYGDIISNYQIIPEGWIVGVSSKADIYYFDMRVMIYGLSLLGLILFIVLGCLLHHLNKEWNQSDTENKNKTHFLAKMSHEIRTPMNSILGVCELLMRKDVSGELHEYISIINHAGTSLLAIINDILDFTKIESGKLELEEKEYEVLSLINDVINVMRVRFTEKPVDFFVSVNSNIPARLTGDEARIRQVLFNLLNNAAKYTQRGFVRLAINPYKMDGKKLELHFTVSDSGIGIKKTEIDHIFYEFFRTTTSVKKSIEGTGLGLTIARSLCLAMGGDISASSEYGKGSVFTARITQRYNFPGPPLAKVEHPEEKQVLLFEERPLYRAAAIEAMINLGISPVCKIGFDDFMQEMEKDRWDFVFVASKYAAQCAALAEEKKFQSRVVSMMELGESSVFKNIRTIMMPIYSINIAQVINGSSGPVNAADKNYRNSFTAPGVKVLIVDDISTNLRVASELMAPYGMEIHTSLYGHEAVEMVRKNRYDLVFMDHMMPGMDGIQAVAAIREMGKEDPYFCHLPIIMLTANAVSGQREMFLQNGLNDFLAKPIEMKKLNAVLKNWIPESKLIRISEGEKTPPSETKETLPEIPGIDVQAGLNNSGGALGVYMNILADYCQTVKPRLIRIKDAAENRDFELYTTLVHGIKGAARSIGALKCGDYAAILEEAGKNKDDRIIQDRTSILLTLFSTQINAINETLGYYQAGQLVLEKQKNPGLNIGDLKRALAGMDIKTVNKLLMDFSQAPLEPKLREAVSEIEQCILMFEYDKAMEKIDMLCGQG